MAVAAATAVIAPAALLSAPAAFADPSPTPTETASTTQSESPSAPSQAPSSTPATTPSAPVNTPSSPAATPSTPASSAAATPSATASEPGEGDEDPDFECKASAVDVKLAGFPNKIVAGGGWKKFSLDVKNNSKEKIENFGLFTFASYEDDLIGGEQDRLIEKYAHFEYFDKSSGEWKAGGNLSGMNNGFYFDVIDLKKAEKRSIKLRVRIDKAAPAGKGIALAAGGYDKGDDCFEDSEFYEFDVLKAGSNAGDVDDAKPSGEKPKDVKPQGGSKEIPVTGNLAETGSSSMLPTVGIAGGIAIVAGAGVVFAMKRRRSGDATA
ncbi:LPXTG cell wall anchor domain-containing protein [Streptomyces sp. NPDC060064]|uniref:LPXTG cell wall anchor domain-containing protein n=1 Tax=Streptomyces sp. NPDC060064 TaxID=3347049 RepID=UPI0036B5B565